MKNLFTYTSWHDIPWETCNKLILNIQREIVVAYRMGNMEKVLKLQKELTESVEGCVMAVRKVVTNRGKNTPGNDNIIWDTPESRLKA